MSVLPIPVLIILLIIIFFDTDIVPINYQRETKFSYLAFDRKEMKLMSEICVD